MPNFIFRALALVVTVLVLFVGSLLLFPITFAQTVDLDAELPSIELNGYRFHAETMGSPDDPVVIVLHGGPGGDYRNLLPVAPLSDQYFLVFYDQRMTGLSSREWDGTLDLQTFFDDLDAFVDHFGQGRKVTLLGHSWGAMMASGYVGMHPEKVDKAILIEPGIMRPDLAAPYFESQSGPGLEAYPALAWIWLNSWRVDTSRDQYARDDYIMSHAYFHMPGRGVHCGDVIPTNFEGWRASRKTLDETVMAYVHDPELLRQLDFISDVAQFEGDVLFMASSCNTVYGSEYQQRHLPFFQNAQLVTVENSGHFIFYDQPESSIGLIRDFLND